MRPVNVTNVGLVKDENARSILKAIILSSQQADLTRVAQAFTISGTYTPTRTLNVTSPTLANAVAVLATFIADCQRGGQSTST